MSKTLRETGKETRECELQSGVRLSMEAVAEHLREGWCLLWLLGDVVKTETLPCSLNADSSQFKSAWEAEVSRPSDRSGNTFSVAPPPA